MAPEVVVLDSASFGGQAARRIATEIRRILRSRDRCSLALSGGETPRPVYRCLAAELPEPESWRRVEVYFADERCVPPDDAASNYRMVRETLLDLLPAAPAGLHRMEGERSDRDGAARAYEALLPGRLDLLILGLGPDGHIASLFPGSPSLAESRRRVLAVTAPKPPPERLTITPPVIRAARLTIGLVAGAGKAEALARVLDGPDDLERTPGRLARGGLWLVDAAAAGRLQARQRAEMTER
jgi:6-phosphogluconolactonase